MSPPVPLCLEKWGVMTPPAPMGAPPLAAGDIQRITAFIRRSIRQGYCNSDHADITNIINTADDTLFRQILTNPNHVLAHLLPEKVNKHYQLRPRQHDRQLIPKTTKLYSCNFVIRMLYKHSYWLYFIVHHWLFLLLLSYYCLILYKLRTDSLILNEDDDDDDVT